MDTKLKNYRHKWAKAAAFSLTVLLLAVTGMLFLDATLKIDGSFESAFSDNYLRSTHFGSKIQEATYQVEEALNNLPKGSYTRDASGFFKKTPDGSVQKEENQTSETIVLKDLTFNQGSPAGYPGNLADVKYYFYYRSGDLEITNTSLDKILSQKYYVGREPNTYALVTNPDLSETDKASINRNPYLAYLEGTLVDTGNNIKDDTALYVAYDDEVTTKAIADFEDSKGFLRKIYLDGGIMVFISLLLFIYLTLVAGRRPDDEEIHLWKIDKIFGEFHLIFCGILTLMCLGTIVLAYDTTYEKIFDEGIIRILVLLALITLIPLAGMFWLSLCRKFKNKPRRNMFFTTGYLLTLILKIALVPFKKLWAWIKMLPEKSVAIAKYFDNKLYAHFPVTQKIHKLSYMYLTLMVVLSFFAIVSALSWLGLFTFVCVGAMIYITIIFIKKSKENFDEINQGFDKGYRESLKAEKMRVDLITNVSHDLKTPLTSIISYADLLKNEDMSDAAKDYVEILDKKAKRLNVIVGDLFDLSKSTSGNLNFDLEEINLKKLIEQTYADMDDKISVSPLKFILQLPEEPVNIYADGKKMYRVFQNLFDNALKYSLDGTRVYITLDVVDNVATASVKNIASYEMNFTEAEIAERFTRGDSARTTDGSGLGLSIAESFTQNCHGQFKIAIDGDLFKVTIKFQTV